MHPGLLIGPALGLLLGASLGFLIAKWTTRPWVKRLMKGIALGLCGVGWLGYLAGVLYWRFAVEPRLDGSEGAGVGFGYVLIHLWGLVLALFLSGFATGIRWKPSRRIAEEA